MSDVIDSLPDIPRWVEARAIHLSGCGRVFVEGDACVIRNEQPGGRLVVVVGPVTRNVLEAALSDRPDREVLCVPEHDSVVAALLPTWNRERAYLYQLNTRNKLAPPDDRVRLLAPEDSLEHLPAELQTELACARSGHDIYTAFVAGHPASFAYAHWETEGQFDISVDTALEYRRQGLAQVAVSELTRSQGRRGRNPGWGALETNVASRCLAEVLGFRVVDEVVLFSHASES